MTETDFFDARTAASAIKAHIVSKYFWAWAKIVMGKGRQAEIAYVDLFAGPGQYGDGAKSTPLLVLEAAIREPRIGQAFRAVFNDQDAACVEQLRRAVAGIQGIETLKYAPHIAQRAVDDEVVHWLEAWSVPSLVFLDPFGYKGLSSRLIEAGLRHKFTDVIFFFNFNRVNAAITNEFMEDHVEALLTPPRLADLRKKMTGSITPERREEIVLGAMLDAVSEGGRRVTHHFRFTPATVNKTSHYIIFVSKSAAGLTPMKDIMGKASSVTLDGVPTFEYAPRATKQLGLFEKKPTTVLREDLLVRFAGRTLTASAVYEEHNVGTRFLKKNYWDVLLRMEAEGLVRCEPPAPSRRKNKGEPTLGPDVLVTFPSGVRPGS